MKEPLRPSDRAWREFTKRKESNISNLFYGQTKSTVKCCECGIESSTYESFSNLSLELPLDNKPCSLENCLHSYFKGEEIDDWNCPKCKEKRKAIKKLDISKLPPVLVIHFKRCVWSRSRSCCLAHQEESPLTTLFFVKHFRFYEDYSSSSRSYRKKQTTIDFPLTDFDVRNYLSKLEGKSNKATTYDLWAVSNHYGTTERGHYTAFCRNLYKKR